MDSSSHKIKVVVVDDDESFRNLVVQVLSAEPRIELVGTGANGRDALQLANRLRPDVMLLDIQMPLLNGLEAAARISKAFPSIAVVILTGDESVDRIKEAIRSGAKDFVAKVSDVHTIASRVIEAERRRDPLVPARGLATVWAFYGVKGNCGCTTLALSAAVDLASLGFKVVFLELELPGGDASVYLGLPPPPRDDCLLSALSVTPDLTGDTLKKCVTTCHLQSAELDLFASPELWVPLPGGIEERVGTLLDALSTTYDYIVVDLPAGRIFEPHAALLFDFAERFFLVGSPNGPCLRRLARIVDTVGKTAFSLEKLTVLLGALAPHPGLDARRWLSTTDKRFEPIVDGSNIPADAKACAASIDRGLPVLLAEPGSPFSAFVRSLVDRALNRAPAVSQRGRLWEKIRRILRL